MGADVATHDSEPSPSGRGLPILLVGMEDRDVDPELERRMARVLLQLALTSNGNISRPDPGTSGVHLSRDDVDYTPKLGSEAPHLYWRRLWDLCKTDDDREFTLDRAERDLLRIRRGRKRPAGGETREERDRRIVDYGEGLSVKEVALSARCGERDVRQARFNAGRDTELGLKLTSNSSPRDRATAARRYADQGLPAPRIAVLLGVSTSTIRRDLGLKVSRR